jgi:transposase
LLYGIYHKRSCYSLNYTSFTVSYIVDHSQIYVYSVPLHASTDIEVFKGFLERLLPFCGRYPELRSVIFMDNASFHFFSQRLVDLFAQAGVIIEYQVPYSPDLSPIEYFFSSVKNRIRKRSQEDVDHEAQLCSFSSILIIKSAHWNICRTVFGNDNTETF